MAQVVAVCNEIRLAQAELVDAPPQRRAGIIADVIDSHLARQGNFEERQRFLELVEERFPIVVESVQVATPSPAPAPDAATLRATAERLEAELSDPFKLATRLADLWAKQSTDHRRQIIEMLQRRAPVPVPASGATTGPTPPTVPAASDSASSIPPAAVSPGTVDPSLLTEFAAAAFGPAAKTPPKVDYPRLIALATQLIKQIQAWDLDALASLATLNIESSSLRYTPFDEFQRATRQFFEQPAVTTYEQISENRRRIIGRSYLQPKTTQLKLQLSCAAQMVGLTEAHLRERFAPRSILEKAAEEKTKHDKSVGLLGKAMSVETAFSKVLEQRLSGTRDFPDLKTQMQDFAGEGIRTAMGKT